MANQMIEQEERFEFDFGPSFSDEEFYLLLAKSRSLGPFCEDLIGFEFEEKEENEVEKGQQLQQGQQDQ